MRTFASYPPRLGDCITTERLPHTNVSDTTSCAVVHKSYEPPKRAVSLFILLAMYTHLADAIETGTKASIINSSEKIPSLHLSQMHNPSAVHFSHRPTALHTRAMS